MMDTKPKGSGDDLSETEPMELDVGAIEHGDQLRSPQQVTSTNAVDNSELSVWCKDNGLTDQVAQTLQDAGFRTPKDLMDREDDLDDLEQLSKRDGRMLGAAIERMRNASASNSVSPPRAAYNTARGDAPADAQRAAQLDDDEVVLRSLFQRAKQSLQDAATESPPEMLIRRPLPPSMLLSDCYYGDRHERLRNQINVQVFNAPKPNRFIQAAVQSFGYGKTKMCLKLTDSFIVLPFRFESELHTMLSEVMRAERELLEDLEKVGAEKEGLERLSRQCFNIVELALLSLVHVLDLCCDLGLIDLAIPGDRFLFAACAIDELNNDKIIQIAVRWFRQNYHRARDNTLYEIAVSLWQKKRSANLLFLVDEVHVLQGKCRGYCLHRTETANASFTVEGWRGERNEIPAPGHKTCTDLFYQLRFLMLDLLRSSSPPPAAFVITSTLFSSWRQLDDELKTYGRGTINQFNRLCPLSLTNCADFITHYFRVPLHTLYAMSDQWHHLTRPFFICGLIQALAHPDAKPPNDTSDDEAVKAWLWSGCQAGRKLATNRASECVRKLRNRDDAICGETGRGLMQLLFISVMLNGGVVRGYLDAPNEQGAERKTGVDRSCPHLSLFDILDHGVVRLKEEMDGYLVIDEPQFVEAILKEFATPEEQDAAVLRAMERLLTRTMMQLSNDTTLKGYTFEYVVAWLVLSKKLLVPSCPKPTARLAGPYAHLPLARGEEHLYVRRMLKGELVGTELDRILLPSTLCGPDVLFHGRNGDAYSVAIQVKVKDVTCTYPKLVKWLKSLAPANMYGKRNAKKDEKAGAMKSPEQKVRETAARKEWKEFVTGKEWPKNRYDRIVFAALGFNSEVYHAVIEYNLRERTETRTTGTAPNYIYLLNLNDVRPAIGEGLFHAVKRLLRTDIQPNVGETMPLYQEWRARSIEQKQLLNEDLEDLCRRWSVTYSGLRKDQMIKNLDSHAAVVDSYYRELQLQLVST